VWCSTKNQECPYPDIIQNLIDDNLRRADVAPEVECATGAQLSDASVCGVAALACLDTVARINAQGVQNA
jgi:hypothetical protein